MHREEVAHKEKLMNRLHKTEGDPAARLLQAQEDLKNKAEPAMKIYVPIAHKLGLDSIEWELQDLGFKMLYPEDYKKIKPYVGAKRDERDGQTKDAADEIRRLLAEKKIDATVQGRAKSFYSIYKKMKKIC